MTHCRAFLVLALALIVSVSSVMADQNIPLDAAHSWCTQVGLTAHVYCNWHRTQQPCGSPTNYISGFEKTDPGNQALCCGPGSTCFSWKLNVDIDGERCWVNPLVVNNDCTYKGLGEGYIFVTRWLGSA